MGKNDDKSPHEKLTDKMDKIERDAPKSTEREILDKGRDALKDYISERKKDN